MYKRNVHTRMVFVEYYATSGREREGYLMDLQLLAGWDEMIFHDMARMAAMWSAMRTLDWTKDFENI